MKLKIFCQKKRQKQISHFVIFAVGFGLKTPSRTNSFDLLSSSAFHFYIYLILHFGEANRRRDFFYQDKNGPARVRDGEEIPHVDPPSNRSEEDARRPEARICSNAGNKIDLSTAKRKNKREGAPVDDVQDEKGEREEESGDLVDVNGCCSALAASVVLHGRRSDGASAPLGLVPHWCLLGRNTFNKKPPSFSGITIVIGIATIFKYKFIYSRVKIKNAITKQDLQLRQYCFPIMLPLSTILLPIQFSKAFNGGLKNYGGISDLGLFTKEVLLMTQEYCKQHSFSSPLAMH
ncbi:hypothetical protein WN51_02238 [Melipona quadrifasciata]|uniref:Uncharacterized protein n=1 Tax=Melipona quadrifasciata TaxID=166423 RepID=A0A0N0BDZ1_9HYME|nr:hypothetical protein WN51_02238 [Melipona quadrifasciata]